MRLIDAIEEMRGIGFRLNYPCYSILLMGLAKLSMGQRTFLVYRRLDDGLFLEWLTISP